MELSMGLILVQHLAKSFTCVKTHWMFLKSMILKDKVHFLGLYSHKLLDHINTMSNGMKWRQINGFYAILVP